MATDLKTPSTLKKMTPEQREQENLRLLREEIEETKSGILKKGGNAVKTQTDESENN